MIPSWPKDLPGRQEVIAKLKIYEFMLITVFLVLATITSCLLWTEAGWFVAIQVAIILLVGGYGEHYISGQGYYTEHKHNGIFVGRVPLWIPFMWVFVVQGSLVLLLMFGLNWSDAIVGSGVLCLLLDLVIIEPALSKKRALWAWTPVENGYFGFLPSQLDRFTAPLGNYLVWLIFPFIANWFLYSLMGQMVFSG